jgi:hypothetical protein
VNRLSVGVQGFDARTAARLGRRQDAAAAPEESVGEVADGGAFDSSGVSFRSEFGVRAGSSIGSGDPELTLDRVPIGIVLDDARCHQVQDLEHVRVRAARSLHLSVRAVLESLFDEGRVIQFFADGRLPQVPVIALP